MARPAGEYRGVVVVEGLGSIGSLVSSPWIYALVAVSVLLDIFLPVLPSGVLVITAATSPSSSRA
ncbi:hypothetical protein STENM327S_02073 [Streptomyces tendae]